MKIAVIGGTGPVGLNVAEQLMRKGHEVLAAARSGVTLVTDEDLHEALAGADVVVDLSNSPAFEARAAQDFFRAAGGNLAAAEVAAGVRHHVAISAAATERSRDSFHVRARLAQEHLIKSSPVPYTLIRATRCFGSIHSLAWCSTEDDAARPPPARRQPVAVEEVAAAVADAALADPVNGTIVIVAHGRHASDAPEYDNVDPMERCFDGGMNREPLVPDVQV